MKVRASAEELALVVESVFNKLVSQFGVELISVNLPELAMAFQELKSNESSGLYDGSGKFGFLGSI